MVMGSNIPFVIYLLLLLFLTNSNPIAHHQHMHKCMKQKDNNIIITLGMIPNQKDNITKDNNK